MADDANRGADGEPDAPRRPTHERKIYVNSLLQDDPFRWAMLRAGFDTRDQDDMERWSDQQRAARTAADRAMAAERRRDNFLWVTWSGAIGAIGASLPWLTGLIQKWLGHPGPPGH